MWLSPGKCGVTHTPAKATPWRARIRESCSSLACHARRAPRLLLQGNGWALSMPAGDPTRTRCNAAAGCAFASVTAGKTARCKQERPDDERDPEAVPVRKGVVWMREGNDGALHLRRPLRVQEHLPVRRRLRLQLHEVEVREPGEGEALAPLLSPRTQDSDALLWLHPVLPGSPHVQSMHPRSAQEPHQCTTRLRRASRARKTRTPALLAVMPASTA